MKLIYRNFGKGGTTAEVQCLPGDAMRVKVRLARPWTFYPGQHAYIYMPAVGWWMSHPFSVAWSDEDVEETMSEKDSLPKSNSDVLARTHCNIYFLIKRNTGFTDHLWKKAEKSPDGKFTTHAFLEGPYNRQRLHSYGTVILFAAGIGITHQTPHVRDLVRGYSNGTVAARRVVLVWTVQNPECLEWIREWMTAVLAMPRRREILRILIFVSKPKSGKEIYSPSSSVQMLPGRPNIQAIMDQEVEQSIGAIGVSVCGPGGYADEVRRACRSWMGKVSINFEEESFSW
jgi:NAD(P)H-flavin reductase